MWQICYAFVLSADDKLLSQALGMKESNDRKQTDDPKVTTL